MVLLPSHNMYHLKVIIVFIALCCVNISSIDGHQKGKIMTSVKCKPDSSLIYNFKTRTLIGNNVMLMNKENNKGKSGRTETVISGSITLTCPNLSANLKQKKHNIMVVSFENVLFEQYQGRTNSMKKYRKLITKHDMTRQLNEKPFIFTQSQSGHVQNLIFKQSEERYIRSIKKGIIRMLTTETKKSTRYQTDGFGGKYKQVYNKRMNKNGQLSIYQQFNQDDFKSLPLDKRHLHYEGIHRVNIYGNLIKEAFLKLHFSFGLSKEKKHFAFKEFEKLINKTSDIDRNDASTQIETLFIGKLELKQVKSISVKVDQELNDLISNLEKNGRLSKLGNDFKFENSFGVNKFDRKTQQAMKRKEFSMKIFKNLMKQIQLDPSLSRESNQLLSSLAKYSKLNPIKAGDMLLSELRKGINLLNNPKTNKQERNSLKIYLESLQNLAATIKSQRIQNSLIQLSTMNPYLTLNFIYCSILIPYPTENAFKLLKTLKSKGLSKMLNNSIYGSEIDHYEIQSNAYMAYADLASRIQNQKIQHEIVKEILTRISNSKTLNELKTNFHALNNAGRAIPIEILHQFLHNKSIPDSIKVQLMDNLKKRKKFNEAPLTNMIHSILNSNQSKRFSPMLKSALIHAQSEREYHLKSDNDQQLSSIPHLVSLYKRTRNDEIRNAIRNFMYHVGTQRTGDELAKMMKIKPIKNSKRKIVNSSQVSNVLSITDEDQELLEHIESEGNLLVFGRMKRAFKRLGGRMRSGLRRFASRTRSTFSKVGSKIKSSAKRVGRRIKSTAKRVGQRIKRTATRVGRSIKGAAQKVAKGVVKATKWVKDKMLKAINAVKKIYRDVKQKFIEAKFNNQKTCLPADSRGDGKDICFHHPVMIDFVRKQGDLSTISKSKHFEYEGIVGAKSTNLYTGFFIYAGASFKCQGDDSSSSSFDVVLLTKANINANVFNRELVLLEASAELTKRPDQLLNDNIYVKVFETTFINANFIPERIRQVVDSCFSQTKPLLEKRFPKLAEVNINFNAGPIPIVIHVYVSLNLGIELRYGICVAKLEASASVEPYAALTVTGSANIGIPIARVGLYVKGIVTNRFIPRLAFEKCNLCAMLQYKLDETKFDIGLTLKISSIHKEWKFYRFLIKPYVKTLFEKCISVAKIIQKVKSRINSRKQRSLQKTSQPQLKKTISLPNTRNTIEKQQERAERAALDPDGYQVIDNQQELPNKVKSHEELLKTVENQGLSNWVKKTSDYHPMFGPNAERIPLSGGKPPSPSAQSLQQSVTIQKVKSWTSQFLKSQVPKQVIEKVGIEKLRFLPNEYFNLNMEDRMKIPNEILNLQPIDLKHFIEKLPKRYNKKNEFIPPSNAFTHIWSSEVLQERLPKRVMNQVGLKYLRKLSEEILLIRLAILEKIPNEIYEQGNQSIIDWICENGYNRLCSNLVKLIKSDTGMDMSPQPKKEIQPFVNHSIKDEASLVHKSADTISRTDYHTREYVKPHQYYTRPFVNIQIKIPQ